MLSHRIFDLVITLKLLWFEENTEGDSILPKGFFFPFLGESHGSYIYIGELRKELFEMVLHVILGRDDIYEPLKDANIIKCTIGGNIP